MANSLFPHDNEAADGEHHVNQTPILDVDHQFVDLARILILAIDRRPGSGRLAPPRPVVSSATAEEQKQYDYYQDSFHIITTSLSWNELNDIILEQVLSQAGQDMSHLNIYEYI